MICCENNFCLYWQDDTCLLENISLSLQGVCHNRHIIATPWAWTSAAACWMLCGKSSWSA